MKTVGVIESLKTEDGSQKLDVGCWKTADACPNVEQGETGGVDGRRLLEC